MTPARACDADMGTCTMCKRFDGSIARPAQIFTSSPNAIVYRENGTFDRRQVASAGIARSKTGLREPGSLEWPSRLPFPTVDAFGPLMPVR